MGNTKIQQLYTLLIGLAALLVATIALCIAKQGKEIAEQATQIAKSEIEVTERNSLATPIFDEASGKYRFLVIYEIGVSNLGGPDIQISELRKMAGSTGFLVLLKGQEIVNDRPAYQAFLAEPTLTEISANPKLLKTVMEKEMGESAALNYPLPLGATKTLRFGVVVDIYDQNNAPLANILLISYQLAFSNGKSYLFRRGTPLPPVIAR
jgi:hypothetical protein